MFPGLKQKLTIPGYYLPVADDILGLDSGQVGDNDDISILSRSDTSDGVIQGKALGHVQCGNLYCRNRIEAEVNRFLDDKFHVAIMD